MLNEIFILQLLIFLLLFFFAITFNILTLWYLAGIYLIAAGILLIIDDCDIFIGFLWIIDLGVGFIFFVFILHFSQFLYQKTIFYLSLKFILFYFILFYFILFYFILFYTPIDLNFNYELKKTWQFLISWYDYYNLFYLRTVTELHLLREIYFYNNSFEFFLINFLIFYGIILSVNTSFLIKRIFNFLTFSQINNFNVLNEMKSVFFIRNQNFLKQQNASVGIRVWWKNKFINK